MNELMYSFQLGIVYMLKIIFLYFVYLFIFSILFAQTMLISRRHSIVFLENNFFAVVLL